MRNKVTFLRPLKTKGAIMKKEKYTFKAWLARDTTSGLLGLFNTKPECDLMGDWYGADGVVFGIPRSAFPTILRGPKGLRRVTVTVEG